MFPATASVHPNITHVGLRAGQGTPRGRGRVRLSPRTACSRARERALLQAASDRRVRGGTWLGGLRTAPADTTKLSQRVRDAPLPVHSPTPGPPRAKTPPGRARAPLPPITSTHAASDIPRVDTACGARRNVRGTSRVDCRSHMLEPAAEEECSTQQPRSPPTPVAAAAPSTTTAARRSRDATSLGVPKRRGLF